MGPTVTRLVQDPQAVLLLDNCIREKNQNFILQNKHLLTDLTPRPILVLLFEVEMM